MPSPVTEVVKRSLGWAIAHSSARYNYRNAVFILAHMRCGSTALSNILCSRGDISGYGEAHIRYDGRGALGRLGVNQRLRHGWNPKADYLFDKVLHSRHDNAAPPEFFAARAIFMLREPEPTIRSIVQLFTDLDRGEYRTNALAAEYYVERVSALIRLWDRFAAERRFGITHGGLLQEPGRMLDAISDRLGFEPALENRYSSPAASRRGGGGDPMQSGKHSSIQPALLRPARPLEGLELPPELARQAQSAYAELHGRFAADWSNLAF